MRPFTVIDAPQRSPEWKAARLGRLTGSKADAMMTAGKGSAEAAGRRNLRVQIVLERLTGRVQEKSFTSDAMEDGIEREPDAYARYEALTGTLLTGTGFLQHTDLMAGCSLDGHVGDFEGLIEIKSPTDAIHLEYLRSGKVPTKYLRQITHALWMTDAAWCDFMSYNPNFPERMHARVIRVARGDVDVEGYEAAARRFLAECDQETASLLGWSVMESA